MNLIQLKEELGNCGKVADNVKHDDAYEEISMMITTGKNLSGRRPRS